MNTTVQIVPPEHQSHFKWSPLVRTETDILMKTIGLDGEVREKVIEEASSILGQCIDPSLPTGNVTGLVVGYVQSGKTVSFTTVSALARDNGFQIIIVIAGTTVPLLRQSRTRLERDLSVHRITSRSPWLAMPDPSLDASSDSAIRNLLEQWADPDAISSTKRTLFVTVMKHHRHLEKLVEVLARVDLNGVPVLIIDDEGDQAGLNARVRQGEESTTYERLLQLRAAIPNHAYLEYTATPQAPLLINIMDWLSPDFAEILTPGAGYVGGKDLFYKNSPYIAPIPLADTPSPNHSLSEAPDSLLSSIRVFLLGCAAHTFADKGDRRSMMIHPSSQRLPHREYFDWSNNYCEQLKSLLARAEGDAARDAVIGEFHSEYSDLAKTVTELPPFETLIRAMKSVLRELKVLVFNAGKGKTPEIHWDQHMYWLLVGGLALDRGFTVEGLMVTYMPRGLGVGNADNLQQRGRFFGYKRSYLEYCRVYLETDVRRAFELYVESEEDIRGQLKAFRGKSLTEWRRQFMQTRLLKPTRRDVIDIDYRQFTIGSDWVYPGRGYEKTDYVEDNRILFSTFIANVDWQASDFLDNRGVTSPRNVLSRMVKLSEVVELLASYRTNHADDSAQLVATAAMLQQRNESNPDEAATVILVASGNARFRGLDIYGKISQLFQGAQYRGTGSSKVQVYLSEREMRDPARVTVHLSILNLGGTEAQPAYTEIPHIAVYLASSKQMVIQPQGGKMD